MVTTYGNRKVLLLAVIAIITACIGAGLALLTDRDGRGNTMSGEEVMHGMVTSKFTDCVGGEKLDTTGKIVPIGQITCDGGSTITLDHKHTFITATGYVRPEHAYQKDVSSIRVGDKVLVRYVIDNHGNKSLNCEGCGVTKEN